MQFGLGHPEYLAGDLLAHAVHRLHGGAQAVTVLEGIVIADTAAVLHRVAGHPVDAHPVADNVGGAGNRGLCRRRVAALEGVGFVARVLLPQRRRAVGQRIVQRGQNRQIAEFSDDQLGGILCLVQRLGDDERHRLADVTHPALRQQRTDPDETGGAVHLVAGRQHADIAEPATGQIVAGQHRQHAGRGPRRLDIQRHDIAMGNRRTEHRRVGQIKRAHIVQIAPLALQQPQVFLARYGFTDHVH